MRRNRQRRQQGRFNQNNQRNNNNNNNNRNNNTGSGNRTKQRFVPNFNRSPAVKNNNAYRPTKAEVRRRVTGMLCMHCTRIAGKNKYHEGPYGGGPESNCPFDKQGNRRPNKPFVSHIYEYSVNELDIPDVKEMESDGLTYENDEEEVDNDTMGVNLLTGALGHYDVPT